jgi:hypothetical protein
MVAAADDGYSKKQQLQPDEANLDTGAIDENKHANAVQDGVGDASQPAGFSSPQAVRSSFGDAQREDIG